MLHTPGSHEAQLTTPETLAASFVEAATVGSRSGAVVDDLRVAVVGAGIGGLTLALALRRHGIACDIYEKTASSGKSVRRSPSRPTRPASSRDPSD